MFEKRVIWFSYTRTITTVSNTSLHKEEAFLGKNPLTLGYSSEKLPKQRTLRQKPARYFYVSATVSTVLSYQLSWVLGTSPTAVIGRPLSMVSVPFRSRKQHCISFSAATRMHFCRRCRHLHTTSFRRGQAFYSSFVRVRRGEPAASLIRKQRVTLNTFQWASSSLLTSLGKSRSVVLPTSMRGRTGGAGPKLLFRGIQFRSRGSALIIEISFVMFASTLK